MSREPRKVSSHLGMESLESRTMLAGNVTVAVLDGDVIVHGDFEANQIGVATNESGALVIEGLEQDGVPTTINGQSGPFVLENFDSSIWMHLRGGDDLVRMPRGDFAGNVFVEMGYGEDRVLMGPGPDGRSDSPGVNVGGRLTVDLGPGDDAFAANGVTAGAIGVFAGRGADDIGLRRTGIEGPLRIRTGPGNDQVRLSNVHARFADVETGQGHDRLDVFDSVFARFEARMGAGNDRVRVGGSTVMGVASLSGGHGRDLFVNLGGNRATHYVLAGFEVIRRAADDGAIIDDDASDLLEESDLAQPKDFLMGVV